ncbi:hypothetical protein FRC11_000467 [Ceratobasidium sp. 423]|nr:hypothetical protein FRC11_000467 [Ceratobasidium sp. 423]
MAPAAATIIAQANTSNISNVGGTAAEAEAATEEADALVDVSLDSQGNNTYEDRRKARRPDFSVSKSQAVLFRNQTHLWVEVKNGSQLCGDYTRQMRQYIGRISAAIRLGFLEIHPDVVFMLVDAGQTYYWRITPQIFASHIDKDIWEWAHEDVTFGPDMTAVLYELSQRLGIDMSQD